MAQRLDFAVVSATAAGLALVVLGGASTTASLISWPGEATIEDMRRQAPVGADAAAAAAHASLHAATFADACRHLTDAALASSYTQNPAFDTGALAARALERCPASPHNWLRLALAREADRDVEGARAAWRLSVLTGGYVPRLEAPRLELGLRLLTGSDAEYLDLLAAQVRQAASTAPEVLADAAERTRTLPLVRLMLRGEPAKLEALEKALAA